MELLETTYNPVTITSVSNTTPANASNSVLVTCTVSSAPASGEYVYVRYSTSSTFTTSALAQFTFTGTSGQALIPCQPAGLVYYYVLSSNQISAQITADATTYGKIAYDMATLNLNNNGGPNYTYTQGSATNFGGIYSIPSASCYTTVGAFVTALNAGTVTAPVTCYAIGGSTTETATTGGISITQTGTSTNPIVFQKFGSGAYTIQASAGLTVGALNDAIFKLIGADYITIDGFTLQENIANSTTGGATASSGTTGNNMTEFGIALLHSASTTDGCQNNTIQNNTISLNRTYRNTFGIYSNTRHTATAVTGSSDPTNVTGSNFGNKVYSNTISDVDYGIVFVGTPTAAFMDNGNDIGGSSAATGNTITNWGGNSQTFSSYTSVTGSSFCIYLNNQVNENVSYNTITSAAVTGGTFTFGGILKAYSSGAVGQPAGTITSVINNNTISLSSSNLSGTMDGILNQNLVALSTATFSMNNNSIINSVINGASTASAFGGIINSSAPGILNIVNNTIRGLTSTSVTGGYTGISNSGAVVTTINITNNKIGDATSGAATFSFTFTGQVNAITNTVGASTATINLNNNSIDGFSIVTSSQVTFIQNQAASAVAVNINNNQLGTATGTLMTLSGAQSGGMFFLYNGGATATTAVSFTGNDIRGVTHSVTGTGQHQYIRSNTAASSLTVSNNTFTNLNDNISGNSYFIMDIPNKAVGASTVINNNSIVTGYNKSAAGGTVYFAYCIGSSVNGSTTSVTNNTFSNISVSGSSDVYGLLVADGVSTSSGATATITGNTISNISAASGTVYGIYSDFSNGATVASNSISSISSNNIIYGIDLETNNGQGTFNVYSNTMNNLVSTGAGGNVRGFFGNASSVPTLNVYSNTITSLSSTGANVQVEGILINTGVAVNVYDNLINTISGSGTPANQANGINVAAGTTVNVYRNKIHTISETGALSTTSPAVNGMLFSAGTTVTVYNNFISNLNAANANLADAIRGINVNSSIASSTINLYYNSIYLNASSVGTNFGTSGIYHTTSGTASTAALTMIDNIVTNISTPNGTGVTAAYRRSDATLTNYVSPSDYNLFYAGTPSATKLIYYDGTTGYQTLAAYQTLVSTRDANSISVLPNFTSITDLHLTATNCAIDGAGTPISVLTDIDGAPPRDAVTPDIGADEFTATYGPTLAGVNGTAVCSNKTVSPAGTTYATSTCDLIAKVLPSGAGPAVSGKINTCVTLDATQKFFNSEPYVQRHFDIEPLTANTTSTSATITLYFTNAEFVNFNTNNPLWPKLPTVAGGGSADPNRANLKVTQYHGTATISPSQPGSYTANSGNGFYINPVDANIVYNGSYWAVTFDVTGFSGFYVHTNPVYPLPVSFNYLNGVKQGGNHLLTWSVTCNTTPRVTLTLERSADARNFNGIYSITADAVRCSQPFDYTDAQPMAGINYYRLKIVDIDGKITYSNIIALINGAKGFALMNIAPNPVRGNLFKLNTTSANSAKMEVVISDILGRIVNRQTISLSAGYNSNDVNVSSLTPGTYNIYGITADDKSGLIRFVKE